MRASGSASSVTQITFATLPGLGFITYEIGMTIAVTSSAVNRSQGQAVLRRWFIRGRAPAQDGPERAWLGVAAGLDPTIQTHTHSFPQFF